MQTGSVHRGSASSNSSDVVRVWESSYLTG